jgi:poly(hydroxyalkanoate) granule-associated protein
MLKKAKAEAQSEKTGTEKDDSSGMKPREFAETILKSSHSIWLAGLGAFAKAQQEGSKVFEALVRQGEQLEQKTRQTASDTATAARSAAMSKAKEMQEAAGGTWDKLEQVFEHRVARALSKLGVYTHNDVQRLADRVDQLAEAVNKLLQSQDAERSESNRSRARRSSPPAAKSAAGKSSARKRASKKSTSAAS